MKVSKTLGLLLTALLLSSSALAAKRHFSVQVDTQSPIATGQMLTISLASLDPTLNASGTYDVSCLLNASGVVPVRAKMDDTTNVSVMLNGNAMNLSWDYLSEGSNEIDLLNVNSSNGNFYLKNKSWSYWWENTFYINGSCTVVDHVAS